VIDTWSLPPGCMVSSLRVGEMLRPLPLGVFWASASEDNARSITAVRAARVILIFDIIITPFLDTLLISIARRAAI
jgi:hypothetical protein